MQVPPGVGQEAKHCTSVTDHSCCPVTGHCSVKAGSALRRNVMGVSSPNPVKHSLCLASDLCTESCQKSRDQQPGVSGHVCCHAFMELTDGRNCLTLHGKLEAQGETRSHYIKHILHTLMSPTFSLPLHKSTSLWRQNFPSKHCPCFRSMFS